jgi:hypothetical protein
VPCPIRIHLLICRVFHPRRKIDRFEIHTKAIERERDLYRVTAKGYSDHKNWSYA